MSDTDHPLAQLPPLTLGRSLWAIRPDTLPRLIEAHRARYPAAFESLAVRATAAAAAPRRVSRVQTANAGGQVAVVPLCGVITPCGSMLSLLFGGGGGLIDFRQSFSEAVNNPDVGAIVLDVDSPGGLIDLVPETAQEILDARGSKPIVAIANTSACSAAYWLASQADEVVVTPSGSVGSIGVYMLHEDWSGWNEQQGIKPTYIFAAASPYKVEGNPDEPLSDAALADWQQEVDDLYAMFADAVAAGRGITTDQVNSAYGQGRVMIAERALAAGLVDRVATIEEVIGGLLVPGSTGAAAISASRAARLEAPAPRAQDGLPAQEPPAPSDDPSHVPPQAPPEEDLQPDEPVAEPDTGPDAADAQAIAGVLLAS